MLRRVLGLLGAGRGAPDGPPPPDGDGYRLSEPLSDAEIAAIYESQVLTQEFYGDAYAASLVRSPSTAADDLAAAIVEAFAPATVLDVGCGLGQLVGALRRRGVDALGCDHSEAFLRLAPADVRPHLRRQDVTALDAFADGAFDAVLCTEVLEHLPVAAVRQCVDELRRVARGPIVATIPSFGPNWPGRAGLPLDNPSWRDDARAGRRFARIVVAPDGRPHHGHLTLATYEWWTDLFAGHGLVRERDVENAWLEHPERPLWRHRWNPYVLSEVASAAYVPGETCRRQGGAGWHEFEDWGDRRVRWGGARALLHLRAPCDGPALEMELWSGSAALLRPRRVEVSARAVPHGRRATALLDVAPGAWHEVALAAVPASAGDLVEVTLDVPEPFRADLSLAGSTDARSLGVAVSRIAVAELGDRPAGAALAPAPPIHAIG